MVWRFIVSDKSRKGGDAGRISKKLRTTLIGALLKAGFSILRTNFREILRFGALPQTLATIITLGAIGAFFLHKIPGQPEWLFALANFGWAAAFVVQSLVVGRWAAFCLAEPPKVSWWSLNPDTATRRSIGGNIILSVALLGAAIPVGLVIGGLCFGLSRVSGSVLPLQAAPVMVGLIVVYVGVRLLPYVLARSASLNLRLRDVWRIMGGRRVWTLLIALLVTALALLAVILLIQFAGTALILLFANASMPGALSLPQIAVYMTLQILVLAADIFATPVFLVITANALKEAMNARMSDEAGKTERAEPSIEVPPSFSASGIAD
jgi:hypothetical protein